MFRFIEKTRVLAPPMLTSYVPPMLRHRRYIGGAHGRSPMGHFPQENRLNGPGTSYPPMFAPRFGVKSKNDISRVFSARHHPQMWGV
jgi:hypothetical protein